jgi:hypothetical protein
MAKNACVVGRLLQKWENKNMKVAANGVVMH